MGHIVHLTYSPYEGHVRAWMYRDIIPQHVIYIGAMPEDICMVMTERVHLGVARIAIRDNRTYESPLIAKETVERVLSNPLGPAVVVVKNGAIAEREYWLGGTPIASLNGVVFVPKEQRQIYETIGITLWRGYTFPSADHVPGMIAATKIINGD